MNKLNKKYAVLLLVAFIWGSAFVAQRTASLTLHPLLFLGLRYVIASLCLLPLVLILKNKDHDFSLRKVTKGGLVCGIMLFLASVVQ